MNNEFDIVIVGGGAAGIGAARRLAAHGLTTLLLEATARLGGRAWTQDLGEYKLDLGCEWLHSGDRNAWVGIAEASGFAVDRREPAWGKPYPGLVSRENDQSAAWAAYDAWSERLAQIAEGSDRANEALEAGGAWNAYVRAMTGYISGAVPDRISAADYLAYDAASTRHNWRTPMGYGALVAGSLPASVQLRMATPVERIDFAGHGVTVTTRSGAIRARAAILTVSTSVLAGDGIRLPAALDPWREAAAVLPLGRNEKLFLEIKPGVAFEAESHVLGSLRDAKTGSYYVRPFGWPLIEVFLGGDGARMLEEEGPVAGFSHALGELGAVFGSHARLALQPLVASSWSRMASIGGAYSCALPGYAKARSRLAQPCDDRLFFAGEATHPNDFSTAHGAHDSGRRAAEEVLVALGMGVC